MRLAYAVLLISLTATLLVYSYSRNEVRRRQQQSFHQACEKHLHTLDLFYASYVNILHGLSAYCAPDFRLDPASFQEFVDALRIQKEVAACMFDVGFVLRTTPAQREALVEQARDFHVAETNLARFPGTNAENYVLIHWQNLQGPTATAFATHVFTDEARLSAMFRARDRNALACTDRLDMHLGNNRTAPGAFIVYAPVYVPGMPTATVDQRRRAAKGFTFASFFIGQFWDNIFHAAGEPLMVFEVYEGKQPRIDRLWYSSARQGQGHVAMASAAPLFSHVVTQPGLERDWTFAFHSTPAFEHSPEVKIPSLILVLGILVSLALFVATWSQTRLQMRAVTLAEDLRQANLTLAEKNERLAVTLSSIEEGVITLDITGNVLMMNRWAETMTGWRFREVQGQPLATVLSLEDPHTSEAFICPVPGVMQSGATWQSTGSLRLHPRGAGEILVQITICPMRDAQGGMLGAVVALRDVTERQKLLEEQARNSRLESVGLLAGGIAHDFNNILTAIVGNISLASSEAVGAARELLREAEQACARARDLTQQLLTFSKGGAPIRKTARLGEVVRESSRFAVHGSSVRCAFTLPDEMWPVEADKGQISQVIQNLVINARQAMADGGVVEISARNLTLEPGEASQLLLPPGRYVKISIQDHGPGIRPEHLDRIFDPYFTTKARGSGLGLTTAYSIIKRHQGELRVASKVGAGTCFDIWLPASDRAAEPAEPVAARDPRRLGKGRLLVMDDEPAVLRLLSRMLEKLGYEVVTSADGAEAVRKYTALLNNHQPVDAVIFDLTVPGGMGGAQALKQLLALDPQVRAIVSSGYSDDEIMANYRQYGFHGIVAKPYGMEKLQEALEQVLPAGGNAVVPLPLRQVS